jgi:uncharacterized protein (TIGR03118 family)
MLNPNPARRRARQFVSLALAASLYLSALAGILPFDHSTVHAQTPVGHDDPPQPFIPVIAPGSAYRQTNLVSDIPGLSPVLDPLLVNPWGISMTSSSPFWVANNGTSVTQLLRGDVGGIPFFLNPSPQTVTIPGGLPTGTVANNVATEFVLPGSCASVPCGANFLFASITGNITGWDPNAPAAGSTTAVIASSHPGHVYTGLTLANNGSGNFLYAADFANGAIDVFNSSFVLQPSASFPFADPTIPNTSGNIYHPFNIQAIGGSLYVAYAKVGTGGHDEEGVGNGFVRRFNANGVRDLTFGINNGPLNSPWGITLAPASFGIFGGALLVGNFGEGNPSIHAFNPTTGAFLGTLQNENGDGIEIDELWALTFGNGGNGGDPNTLYFTSGISEEEHGMFGKLNPTTASATSLIQFSTDDFAINEGSGHIDITVTRAGDASNTATVNFNTYDESQPGHASQKSDYEISLSKLTFAPGETSKTVRILIVDDKFVEGDETINLALTNPTGTGVGLGSPNVADLRIIENDAAPSIPNPIDDPTFFVRQHYLDFYNREPDAGSSALVSQITACGADAACVAVRRREVSTSFFNSPEYFGNGSLIARTHKAAFGSGSTFGSPADVLYGDFEFELQALLKDVAIGATGAAQLETNKQAYYNAFVQTPAFKATLDALTNAQYVDRLIANAGATFPAGFRDQLVADLNASAKTRAQVLRAVAENAAFAQQEAARDAVALGFFGYDRRDPDTAGFNAVLTRINSFGGDYLRAGVVNTFMKSQEYRQRFGAGEAAAAFTNSAPTAVNDTASTNAPTPVVIDVVANDKDPDGDFMTVQSVTPGTGGTPTINADGRNVTFTPAPGFAGAASFQYTITDNGYNCASPGCGPFGGTTPNPLTSTASVTVNVASAGTFQLGATTTSVSEGAGKVTLTVTLAGGSTTPVTVDYATPPDVGVVNCATASGHASERCDFNTTVGTLRFAPGESSKTIDIFITDDVYVEGNETFTVTLSNPTGGASFTLGSTTTETVTITDNDAVAPTTNPIDTSSFFVRQQYIDFLVREPEPAGLAFYVNILNGCVPSDTQCVKFTRGAVAANFFRSPEFQRKGSFVMYLYMVSLGQRPATVAELTDPKKIDRPHYTEFMADLQSISDPADDQAIVSAKKDALTVAWLQRPEIQAIYGSLTNAQFVQKLSDTAGVTLSNQAQLVTDLNASTKTRAQVLRIFAESPEVDAKFHKQAFVTMEYFGFLRRDPEVCVGSPNPSQCGYIFHNSRFLSPGDQALLENTIVRGFIESPEYRSRFGPN